MTSLSVFPDPLLDDLSQQDGLGHYSWHCFDAYQVGRRAFASADKEGFLDLLGQGNWSRGQADVAPGESLLAWRGWWSCVQWKSDWTLVENLLATAPLPPADDELDWFGPRARSSLLRTIFLPARSLDDSSSQQDKDEYAQREQVRSRVAVAMNARWPGLASLFLQTIEGYEGSLMKPYSHPLMMLARSGREKDFERLLAVDGLHPLMGPEALSPEGPIHRTRTRLVEALAPTAILAAGLKRGFEPLVTEALKVGASWDGRFTEYGNQQTLLHSVVGLKDSSLLLHVLDRVSDVEPLDSYGRTPFLRAAHRGDVKALEILGARGANVLARDRFGQGAANIAMEGLKVADYDWDRSSPGKPCYLPRDSALVAEAVERLGQTFNALAKLGVDVDDVCQDPPKNTKKSPSPFVGLPRKNRPPHAAKTGQTWDVQLDVRMIDDSFVPKSTPSVLRAALLAERLKDIIPPEPEELESPARSRRPRF